ncbi:NUDIX domain-containing protein [Streptomyces sp. NBC_01476]|uniref:NUDIX domain-containing protein n=1 Tax=Streptomyces sp. NBC_01476 TaxID=2903881 RepID=UPI002E323AF9|nr:NUDIX domain-containing protein [Streptomyces sp. NBC_01476]
MTDPNRPYLVERNPGNFEYQLPISVKVVIDLSGRVPLLKNEREEWELPGGKLELGETPLSTAAREVEEELGLEADLLSGLDAVDSWVYEIFPHRHVFVVSYGAEYLGGRQPRLSHEHKELGLFRYDDIAALTMPEPYKETIRTWRQRRSGG